MTDTVGQDASPASEYLRIIWRRKWIIGLIAVLMIAAAICVALLLPAKYQSTATILIEEPVVSDELSRTTDVAFADQRLQLTQQRVMTTARLIEVIEKLGLYQDARETTPLNVLADNMRTLIDLTLVDSGTAAATNGRNNRATTAFTLSFTGRSPETAQKVTQELVDLYLAENERSQRSRAVDTAGFLSSESSRLAAQIKDLETQLAEFKTAHAGTLPEELNFNMQLLDRSQNQLLEFMRQAQGVRERQAFLQAQLAALEPQAAVNSATPETLSPRARLRLLKSQYSAMNAKYGPRHPDVLNLKRQIEALGGSVGDAQASVNLEELEAQLAAAQEKYGKAHPEVQGLQREIEAARTNSAGVQAAMPAEVPDNPVYVQTSGQINALNAELGAAQAQVAALQQKIAEVEARVLKTPEVERAYVALKRDYDTAVAKYQDLQQRGSQAELAKNLETEQMGERLSLIEPPQLPIEPISPNRPAIVLLGILVGLSAGIAAGFLFESLDGRVYGHRRLAMVTGDSPLVFVPRIRTGREHGFGKRRFATIAVLTVILVTTVLAASAGSEPSSVGSLWRSLLEQVHGI